MEKRLSAILLLKNGLQSQQLSIFLSILHYLYKAAKPARILLKIGNTPNLFFLSGNSYFYLHSNDIILLREKSQLLVLQETRCVNAGETRAKITNANASLLKRADTVIMSRISNYFIKPSTLCAMHYIMQCV